MDTFKIIGKKKEYALVIGTSYESPLSALPSIEEELRSMNYNGNVVFDLLLSNGKASNRFVRLNFDRNSFDHNSFQVVYQVGNDLQEISRSFFRKNKELLNRGVLTDQERFSILAP